MPCKVRREGGHSLLKFLVKLEGRAAKRERDAPLGGTLRCGGWSKSSPARVSNNMWLSWYEIRACLNSTNITCGGNPGTKYGQGGGGLDGLKASTADS